MTPLFGRRITQTRLTPSAPYLNGPVTLSNHAGSQVQEGKYWLSRKARLVIIAPGYAQASSASAYILTPLPSPITDKHIFIRSNQGA